MNQYKRGKSSQEHLSFNLISLLRFSKYCILCLEMDSWQWCGRVFWNVWDCVKGREVKWGEENSWLLFLSWFRNYWPLLSIFFMCPNSALTGKLLSAFLNAPNVYNFLCKEPKLKNKNRRVLKEEGSGRWLKWGPEGHRWEMGGDWGGLGWGDGHMVLITNCNTFLSF